MGSSLLGHWHLFQAWRRYIRCVQRSARPPTLAINARLRIKGAPPIVLVGPSRRHWGRWALAHPSRDHPHLKSSLGRTSRRELQVLATRRGQRVVSPTDVLHERYGRPSLAFRLCKTVPWFNLIYLCICATFPIANRKWQQSGDDVKRTGFPWTRRIWSKSRYVTALYLLKFYI